MKTLILVSALFLGGCVAYPIDGVDYSDNSYYVAPIVPITPIYRPMPRYYPNYRYNYRYTYPRYRYTHRHYRRRY